VAGANVAVGREGETEVAIGVNAGLLLPQLATRARTIIAAARNVILRISDIIG